MYSVDRQQQYDNARISWDYRCIKEHENTNVEIASLEQLNVLLLYQYSGADVMHVMIIPQAGVEQHCRAPSQRK